MLYLFCKSRMPSVSYRPHRKKTQKPKKRVEREPHYKKTNHNIQCFSFLCVNSIYFFGIRDLQNKYNIRTFLGKSVTVQLIHYLCGWFSYNVVRVPPVFLVFVFFCDVVYMRQRVTWGFICLPDIKSKCLYVHLYIASTCTDCSISKFWWVGSKCVSLSYPG
jgi:hypothetical protein